MATLVNGDNILSFNICQKSDCNSFDFIETSGGSSVPGGWGYTNCFNLADAISSRLTITLPDNTVLTPITIYPEFPTDDINYTKNITSNLLGLTGFSDGLYIFKYEVDILNVNSDIITLSATKTELFTCKLKCCVDKQILKLAQTNCTCDSQVIKDSMLVFSLYQALLASGTCGNYTNITNIINTLNKLCSKSNCGCK